MKQVTTTRIDVLLLVSVLFSITLTFLYTSILLHIIDGLIDYRPKCIEPVYVRTFGNCGAGSK